MTRTPLARRILAGGGWALSGKLATGAGTLLLHAMLARLLSPAEVGSYFLVLSVVTVASSAATLGMERAVLRLVPESLGTGRPGRARTALRRVLRYGGAGAIVTALGVTLASRFLIDDPAATARSLAVSCGLIGGWTLARAAQSLVAECHRGFKDLRSATCFGSVLPTVVAAALLAGLLLGGGEVGLGAVFAVWLVANGVSAALGARGVWRRLAALGAAEPVERREVVDVALPLFLNGLVARALASADIWILAFFLAREDVALYGAAAALASLVRLPRMITNLVVPPYIAEMHATGEPRLGSMLRATAGVATAAALLASLAFVALGAGILELAYGEFYRSGAPVLAILSAGSLVSVWTGSAPAVLAMTGHQAGLLRITASSGALTLAALLWAAPLYGVVGVAVAASLGAALQNGVTWLIARQRTGLWTHAGSVLPWQPRGAER